MNETERMKELVKKLNEAAKAYYQEDREIMSNLEYDTLYDELQVLEEKTGVTLAGSPTTKVGYEAMDELPKRTSRRCFPLIKRKMWKCSAASSGITKRCYPGRWTV
jgi:DNA ligase (NAD+)